MAERPPVNIPHMIYKLQQHDGMPFRAAASAAIAPLAAHHTQRRHAATLDAMPPAIVTRK
ncbi:MAG: hypothetical protein WCE63_05820 [Acidobacteriaceae bacterium]